METIKKQKLADEFLSIRDEINRLKRREKILREFFMDEMEGKTHKRYGKIHFILSSHDREKIDTAKLHKLYPEIYDDIFATYTYSTLKCSRS